MPETISLTLYHIDELEDAARERARDWYRQHAFDHDWFEPVYEDFERICPLLGVDLEQRPVALLGGGTRRRSQIWFSGFAHQGDGASFEATYRYARGARKKIRDHAPEDPELHRIADALQAIQRRNFYQLRARIAQQGRYTHEYSMRITIECESLMNQSVTAAAEDALSEICRDLARWLYRQLQREYEFQSSDEAVDEAISANAYTFTEDGRRFG